MMPDYAAPVEWSLELIESLHARWVMLLQSLSEDEWKCGFKHPEMGPIDREDGYAAVCVALAPSCRAHHASSRSARAGKGDGCEAGGECGGRLRAATR